MAKLGGRGMFAPSVLAPKPAAHRQPSSEPKAEPPAAAKEEPAAAPPAAAAAAAGSEKAEGDEPTEPAGAAAEDASVIPAAPGLLVMPKRAAPPRRKQPAAKASTSNAAPKSPAAAEEDHPVPYAPNPTERPIPLTAEQLAEEKRLEQLGQSANGAEGAQQAGIALAPVGQPAQQAVDQPLVQSPVEAPSATATAAGGSDVPTSEPAQAELSHVSPAVAHKERSLIAESNDEEAVSDVDAPVSVEDDARAHAPQHRTSIPLPERESSHHEDTAEFRTAIDTPSALGPRQAFMTPATERQTPTLGADDNNDDEAEQQRKKEELAADTPFPKTGGIVPLPPVAAAGPVGPDEAADEEQGTALDRI
jgi:hypothetical protein